MSHPLSPCVSHAVYSLPEEITAWDLARFLLKMHPEYTEGLMEPHFEKVDKAYHGEKKPVSEWLVLLSENHPDTDLLHTRLAIIGLIELDTELQKMIPDSIIAKLNSELY